MTLHQWAIRHGVSASALDELQALFGLNGAHVMPEAASGTSETAVQAVVRLEAARRGVRLFRNNVGVLQDDTGRPVRYGLANDSKQVNEAIKSGDLIGFRPVLITHDMVGAVIAQFVSRECKRAGWRYTGKGREAAQMAWAVLVATNGGDAAFCTGEGTL